MFQKIELILALICVVHISTTLEKDCGQPKPIDHGMIAFTSTNLTSTVNYSCFPGYLLVGGRYQTCTHTGWEGRITRCRPKTCGHPGEIMNGYYIASSNEFGSKVTFYCDVGYMIIGRDYRLCAAEGWDSQVPICEIVKCDDPPAFDNGRVPSAPNTGIWEFGMIAKYSCTGDNSLIGADELVCTATGEWDTNPPTCKDISCYRPEVPSNGKIVAGFGPTYKYRATITYECDYAYEIHGKSVIECTENSEFLPQPPECKLTGCHQPKITHGSIVSKVKDTYKKHEEITYGCEKGYETDSSRVIQCRENDTFVPPPFCKRIVCPRPENIANGRITSQWKNPYNYGDWIYFTCNSGFVPVGVHSRRCGEGGKFVPSPPSCERVVCPRPENIANGRITSQWKNPYNYGDLIYFTCNSGFVPVGVHSRRCGEGGKFVPSPPSCERVVCPRPENIANGRITSQWKNPYNYGDWIYFTCNSGFIPVGVHSRRCGESGKFVPSPPSCERVVCPRPENIANGRITSQWKNPYNYGDLIYFTCNSGFVPVGVHSRRCGEGGKFVPSPPSCERVVCPRHENIANGRITSQWKNPYNYGDWIYFTCNFGFIPVGVQSRRCGEGGKFVPSPPSCERADASKISIKELVKEIVVLGRQIVGKKEINIKAEQDILDKEIEILRMYELILQAIERF
uniref:zona pellucida sperm-binding protein 3 receptor-like isoform X2 n=1 Tax=Pristiophorus japonicus TaxID=55135 RepID=UPI00398F5CBA